MGPRLITPPVADRSEDWLDWWVKSWEASYREVSLGDLRSADDLADIVFDSGVQLGAGAVIGVRPQALASVARLEGRLKKETAALVEEMLAQWQQLRDARAAPYPNHHPS